MSSPDYAGKFHEKIAQAVHAYKGRELSTIEIQNIIFSNDPTMKGKMDWILPSDHCNNILHEGACDCAFTENAIFEQMTQNIYKVL